MKILLIDPSGYLHNFGMRMIAAQVTAAGHQVEMVFALGAFPQQYSSVDPFLNDLRAHVRSADLVGISVYTNYLLEAIAVTRLVREVGDSPVVWGGVHPTVMPKESLEQADYVVIGEGEDAFPALIEYLEGKKGADLVPNLCHRSGTGEVVENIIQPLAGDLDDYGFPIFTDLDGTYIADAESQNLQVLTDERLKGLTRYNGRYYGLPEDRPYYGFLTMTSRGCPYRCAYCINNAMNRIFDRKSKVFRFRSIEHVIREIEAVRERFPFINLIHFFDDNLCARPLKDLEEFNRLYKARIGFPFKCNFHPNNVSEEKIDLLIDAGLVSVEMGIESGSQKTNRDLYRRPHSNDHILGVARLLADKHPGKVVSCYGVIMDNPWESTEDVSQTIQLIQEIPRPFKISYFSLTFFPGTALYEKAVEEGVIRDLVQDVVKKKNNRLYADRDPYSKLLLSVSPFVSHSLPRRLLRLMAHPWLLRFLNGRYPSILIRRLVKVLIGLRASYNARKARKNTAESQLDSSSQRSDFHEGIQAN